MGVRGKWVWLLAGLAASVFGLAGVGTSQASAACAVAGTMEVRALPNGAREIRGTGTATCDAPAPPSNRLSVRVRPQNALIRTLVPSSSHSASVTCSSGACEETTLPFAYTVGPNLLISLLGGPGPHCYTAAFAATSGGSRSVTVCG